MIKRTLFFSNPAYLSAKNNQLIIKYPEEDKEIKTVPIEDVGMLVLENQQITITNGLLSKLIKNKAAIINCDSFHLSSPKIRLQVKIHFKLLFCTPNLGFCNPKIRVIFHYYKF